MENPSLVRWKNIAANEELFFSLTNALKPFFIRKKGFVAFVFQVDNQKCCGLNLL
jgi:hypothetical protein